MRIAVLADIHGNLLALDAVLADIERLGGVDSVVNLGDCVSGPLWPVETMERLDALDAVTVRGNHDRQVATGSPAAMIASDRFAHERLTSAHRDRLGALPGTAEVVPGILACHGTPARDDAYLLDAIRRGHLVRDAPDAIAARLGEVGPAGMVLCGHSHRPDLVRLPGGILILNPGSVGCPAYDDADDLAHVSEAGSPHARYALLDTAVAGRPDPARPGITFVAVPYAWEDAARRADANDRPEWARALRTGFMSP